MSFKENSFGPGDYDEDIQHNEQQISFVADVEYQTETNMMREEPDLQYKQKLIIEEIKFNLKNLCHVINSRFNYEKLKIFLDLKNFSEARKINRLKAEIIYNKLIFSIKTFLKFYFKKENFYKTKSFLKWQNISLFLTKLNRYKIELEQSLEKKFERESEIYEMRIQEKEKELTELRLNMSKYVELENELIKKIKTFEDKENDFLDLIKRIKEEKLILEEELEIIKKTSNERNECQKTLEEKIKEYENKILSLHEENKEKDYSISLFLREMNELLQAHEKNIDILNLDREYLEENKMGSTKVLFRKVPPGHDVNNLNNFNNLNQFSSSQTLNSPQANFKNLNGLNHNKQMISLNSLNSFGVSSPNKAYNLSQNLNANNLRNSKNNNSISTSLNFSSKKK